jgi:hypothetical protein|tara:strand:- start:55 stop:429 length:375 start_codon:yes stop_codon:yes gene_type:complete
MKTVLQFLKETEISKREATQIIAVLFLDDFEANYSNIRKDHLNRGLIEIGFHFVIQLDGKIFMGRHANQTGNCLPEFDSKSIYICVIGDQDDLDMEQSIPYQMLMEKLSKDFPSCQEIKYLDLL